MAKPSVNLRRWWFAALGGGLLLGVLALAMPGPAPSPDTLAETPPTPLVPASASTPSPIAAVPDRRDITAPLLQVVDWQGQPLASKLTFVANDTLFPSDCPPTGVAMPSMWSHVLVRQPNWLPLCLPATAVETRSSGCWLLRLPEPSLTARVLAPADAGIVQLYAEVNSWAQAQDWPAVLRQHVFGSEQALEQTLKPLPLELQCADGLLSCGGLPAGDIVLQTRNPLVFRRPDGGIDDRWQARLPAHGSVIELAHKQRLRVTPMLAKGGVLADTLSLVVDQRNPRCSGSLGNSLHTARFGEATAVELHGGARFAILQLRAGKDERLVASATIKLTQRDQDEVLLIGADSLTVTVVDGDGAPVPDACVLGGDELLGTTDRAGEVQLLVTGSGPIEAMARGFDCASVGLTELRATRRIVMPPLSTLVVDARRAVQALGRGEVTIRGGLAAPCSSRAGGRLLGEWNERGPSSSMGSGASGGRMMLEELRYDVAGEGELTLVGMFAPGEQVTIGLGDRGGAATGVERTVQLARGEVTRIDLPVPETVQYLGAVVSATDGLPIAEARVRLSGGWLPLEPEPVAGGQLDFRLAKDSGITILASGYVTRSFAQPEANGVYPLTPARRLCLRIVDAEHRAVACRGSLCDGSGQEYSAMAGQPGGELLFEEVPDQVLTAKLRRGDEVREFAVPTGTTSWTVEWR